jgi:hypothetical protein
MYAEEWQRDGRKRNCCVKGKGEGIGGRKVREKINYEKQDLV